MYFQLTGVRKREDQVLSSALACYAAYYRGNVQTGESSSARLSG